VAELIEILIDCHCRNSNIHRNPELLAAKVRRPNGSIASYLNCVRESAIGALKKTARWDPDALIAEVLSEAKAAQSLSATSKRVMSGDCNVWGFIVDVCDCLPPDRRLVEFLMDSSVFPLWRDKSGFAATTFQKLVKDVLALDGAASQPFGVSDTINAVILNAVAISELRNNFATIESLEYHASVLRQCGNVEVIPLLMCQLDQRGSPRKGYSEVMSEVRKRVELLADCIKCLGQTVDIDVLRRCANLLDRRIRYDVQVPDPPGEHWKSVTKESSLDCSEIRVLAARELGRRGE
jgi:hypothetical protein